MNPTDRNPILARSQEETQLARVTTDIALAGLGGSKGTAGGNGADGTDTLTQAGVFFAIVLSYDKSAKTAQIKRVADNATFTAYAFASRGLAEGERVVAEYLAANAGIVVSGAHG